MQKLKKLSIHELGEIKRIQCENSYFEFFKSAWLVIEPETVLNTPPYIKFLCDLLQFHSERLIEGKEPMYKQIIINIPPAASKSSIVTKVFPAWLWIKKASLKIITSSYSSTLALNHTERTRDIILSDWYKNNWGHLFSLKGDSNKKSEYNNTKSGIRFATGVGGTLTGVHAHVFICDDPLSQAESQSDLKRKRAIDWWNKTVPSRVIKPLGFRILVMQRLHENDLTGMVLSRSKSFLHVCLPAKDSNNIKPKGAKYLYQNGFLDNVRLSDSELNEFKIELGTLEYSGQYDQSPTPAEGSKFKRSWFKIVDKDDVYNLHSLKRNIWIDGAYTKNSNNDPTGILLESFDRKTNTLYILDFHEERLEMPSFLEFMESYVVEKGLSNNSRVYFEPKASGKSMKQMLSNRISWLTSLEIKSPLVSEGKESRANVASPKVQSKNVVLIKGDWNETFIDQLIKFPRAKHDEAIDLIGYCANHYFNNKKPQSRRYGTN